jgi:hypothetical protein
VAVLLVLAIWAITFFAMWGDVWTALVNAGPLGFALWGLVLTVLLGGISYLTLRRAVP